MEALVQRTMPATWAKLAIWTGFGAAFAYFFSVVLKPFPVSFSQVLFFAGGPFWVVSATAFYGALRDTSREVWLVAGTVLGVVAGAMVNVMAVVQSTQFTVLARQIAAAPDEATREMLTRILWGVNVVQSGLDVSWDIFASVATVCLGAALLGHPRYGRVFPILGIGAAAGALTLNLWTFPTAPAEAGLVGLGPAVGLWYAVALAQLWRSLSWLDERERPNTTNVSRLVEADQ
ncbi:MAG: hypothetical protein ACE5FJ_12430 [Gemmatimonadales bacterium]